MHDRVRGACADLVTHSGPNHIQQLSLRLVLGPSRAEQKNVMARTPTEALKACL